MKPTGRSLSSILLWLAALGCSSSVDEPLPSEDDLRAYAAAVARRAQKLVPEQEALALYHLGRVEERFGMEDKALELYGRALRINPNLVDVHRQMGFILSQRNDRTAEAVDAYQRALRADPRAPGIYTRLGLIFLHQNKLEEADRACNEEVKLGFADENTYYVIAQALGLRGRHKEALDYYRKSVNLAPETRMSYYGLSQSLSALGQTKESEEALKKFRELKKKEDEATVDPKLGSSNRPSQLQWAAEAWRDAGVLFMHGASSSKDRGRLVALEREFVHAIRQAIRICPGYETAHVDLISYLKVRKEYESAALACEEALKETPSREIAGMAYEIAGLNIENSQGEISSQRVEISLRLLTRLTEIAPSFSDAHREIVRLICLRMPTRKDLFPSAVEHGRKAVESSPTAQNYDVLGLAYYSMGNVTQAREVLEEGLRRHPDDPDLQKRLSRLR